MVKSIIKRHAAKKNICFSQKKENKGMVQNQSIYLQKKNKKTKKQRKPTNKKINGK